MTEKVLKSKYRLGQKVWYIADGYVTSDVIKSVFTNHWGEVAIGFYKAQWEGEKSSYILTGTDVKEEYEVFLTREALIKSIKNQDE